MTMVRRALLVLRASIDWWPGRVMCTGSLPWPYMTAGILLSRRILRAAPLPNWVRVSATSLLSDTCVLLGVEDGWGSRSSTRDVAPNDRRANGPRIHGSAAASVDHG